MKQDMHIRNFCCYCIIIIIVIDVRYRFSIGMLIFTDHRSIFIRTKYIIEIISFIKINLRCYRDTGFVIIAQKYIMRIIIAISF